MTEAQLAAMDIIRDRLATTGNSPTMAELSAALGFASRSTAAHIVDRLVHKGELVRDVGQTRGLRLPGVPSLAGVPTEALEAEIARRAGATC